MFQPELLRKIDGMRDKMRHDRGDDAISRAFVVRYCVMSWIQHTQEKL